MIADTSIPSVREGSALPGGSAFSWILLLLVAGLLAYHNSFPGVMVFDDTPTIERNDSIRDLTRMDRVLRPPLDTTASGRPVANLSFAVNYAMGGLAPGGYHAVNLLIHLLAGLTLFGVVRNTLAVVAARGAGGRDGDRLAFAVALLWLVHPLQTESVTYIVQRVEALAGLFYLLTLHCFIRSLKSDTPVRWQVACVAACFLGVGSKEVVASAPLLVLLYDRTLVAGSFREAWRRRRGFYLAMASSWLLLAGLIAGAAGRGGTAGFGTASSWEYLLTQAVAIVHYLRLSLWPAPLVFDYGKGLVTELAPAIMPGLLVLALAGATGWAVLRRSVWGLVGFWFFAILAPSSSIVPVATQTMAEHRMYLPLVAVLVVVVWGLNRLAGRWGWWLSLAVAVVFGAVTVVRNRDYHSGFALWSATVEARPENPRAVCNLGQALFDLGRVEEAMVRYREALRLSPDYFEAHNNLGIALLGFDRVSEAQGHFEAAVRAKPEDAPARGNLGMIYHAQGRLDDALRECGEAVRLWPDYAEGHSNLSVVLQNADRAGEALKHAEEAVRLKPDYAEAHSNLGMVLHGLQRPAEAIASYERALVLKPAFAEARMNLAIALHAAGRIDDAIEQYGASLRLRPEYSEAHYNLANLLAGEGRPDEALAHFQDAVRIAPGSASNQFALGNALLKVRRYAEALPACEEAVRLDPERAEARSNLGTVLFFTGERRRAIEEFETAIRLNPGYVKAHYFLGNVLSSEGRAREARRHYERALELDPGYGPARENLSRLRLAE